MFNKLLEALIVILFWLICQMIVSALCTAFIFAGWNWGVVPSVTGAKSVGIFTAFWLSVFFSVVGGFFYSITDK